MRDLLVTAHIHDNHGEKDEHLPPYEGTHRIGTSGPRARCRRKLPLVFELKEQARARPSPRRPSVALGAARSAFDRVEQELPTRAPEAVRRPHARRHH